MPAKANLAKLALKYGPVVYTLAQKYGPQVAEQIMKSREPAQRLLQDRAERVRSPRKMALAHADSVLEGTLQQVFHAGRCAVRDGLYQRLVRGAGARDDALYGRGTPRRPYFTRGAGWERRSQDTPARAR